MDTTFIDVFMTYGGIGACLAYFIYKDLTTNKEMKTIISENTKALTQFRDVLLMFSKKDN